GAKVTLRSLRNLHHSNPSNSGSEGHSGSSRGSTRLWTLTPSSRTGRCPASVRSSSAHAGPLPGFVPFGQRDGAGGDLVRVPCRLIGGMAARDRHEVVVADLDG